MADLTVGGKGFEGVIARYNTNCVTDLTVSVTTSDGGNWIDIFFESNTIKAVVNENPSTEDNTRTAYVTINYTADTEYDTDGGTGGISSITCSTTVSIEQKTKIIIPPAPQGCKSFVVNGDDYDAPVEGGSFCDSAFLYNEGIPEFVPSTGSNWIHPRFTHWDEDPHTYEYFCSLYDESPCVAESLMRHAGITPNHKPEMCDGGEPGVPMPQLVYDTINGSTQYTHALGTIWYDVDYNGSGVERECTVRWYVDNIECKSAEFHVRQAAGGGGGGDDPKVIIDGHAYQGDGNRITRNDACSADTISFSVEEHVTFSISPDNGVKINNNTSGELNAGTYTITYEAVTEDTETTIVFNNDDDNTTTITLKRKCDPSHECNCADDMNITVTSLAFDATGGTKSIGTLTDGCELEIFGKPDWITVIINGTDISLQASRNTDEARSGNFSCGINGVSNPCKTFTITQASGEECRYPDATVEIMIKGNRVPSGYNLFYLTDNIIGENCKSWLIERGDAAISQFPGTPISLGYYDYTGCEEITFESAVGTNYCHISSPGSSICDGEVREIEYSTESRTVIYYFYGFDGTNFTKLGDIRMPTAKTCQEGIEVSQGSYTYYVLK